MNERFFSEYRLHDYRTPRSRKEAYGWEPCLWVDTDDDLLDWAGYWLIIVAAGLFVWYALGWV